MPLTSFVTFVAAALGVLLAGASLIRKDPSVATWSFSVGMLLLAVDSAANGLAAFNPTIAELQAWLGMGILAEACLPVVWLSFALTYARAEARAALASAWLPLTVLAALPVVVGLADPVHLVGLVVPEVPGGALLIRSGGAARLFHGAVLLALVLVLMNLEQTFRASIGTMRWRIKYVVLGLGIIFGAHIFVQTQAILYPAYDPALGGIESSALLVGSIFLIVAYARDGLSGLDVYPSRAVLRSSLTVLLVGGYLFVIGVLAQLVRRFGGAESFQLQALLVLIALGALAVLLLSDRLRQSLQSFIGRHFSKAQHDSVRVWSASSRQLASAHDRDGVCSGIAKLLSETFDALSVSVWSFESPEAPLWRVAATSSATTTQSATIDGDVDAIRAGLQAKSRPFDLDEEIGPWSAALRTATPSTFTQGGHRWCVPLRSGEELWGAIILVDRVNGAPYTAEERELLQCIADQMTSALQNLKLSEEVGRSRELQAFQTMSAFFVHDLKNAAASLNLMLKNLPVHFDDPAFRADALRGIGNTARRIDEMIARLSAFRQRPVSARTNVDLNQIVRDAINEIGSAREDEIRSALEPVPAVHADREQVMSVVTNLLLNARDATGANRRIDVRTQCSANHVVLSVSDNGCGMTPDFVRNTLFKPFQSTKSKGLGIGMFQARMMIEAHDGHMDVDSQVGRGTTVRVSLPAAHLRGQE